jgi:hypothetical protein
LYARFLLNSESTSLRDSAAKNEVPVRSEKTLTEQWIEIAIVWHCQTTDISFSVSTFQLRLLAGFGLVGYKQSQSACHSVLPAINQEKAETSKRKMSRSKAGNNML